MAFSHGIEATLKIGVTQFDGYVEGIDAAFARELAEIRTLGATAVQRVAGLEDFSFTANGPFDATADAALYAAFHGSAPVAVAFKPDGVVTYSVNCWVPEYSVSTGSNAAATWSVRLASSGDMTRN